MNIPNHGAFAHPLDSWLTQVCAMLPECRLGAVISNQAIDHSHPVHIEVGPDLFKAAKIASQQQAPLYSQNSGNLIVAYPLACRANTILVVALEQAVPAAVIYRLLDWAGAWLALIQKEQDQLVNSFAPGNSPTQTLDIQAQLRLLATRFETPKAMLLSWQNQQATVAASYPDLDPAEKREQEQAATLCKEGLNNDGLMLELKRSDCYLFFPTAIASDDHLDAYVRLIDQLYSSSLSQSLTAYQAIMTSLKSGFGSFVQRRGYVLITASLAILALVFIETDRHIKISAVVEAKQKQIIAAPFDGYIASSTAKPGDEVLQNDVLATLDGQELQLQQDSLTAQRREREQSYRTALTQRDLANAQIMRAQLDQVNAKQLLLDRQLNQLELKSPLNGVVISGDLSQTVGSPVRQGDTLFEVAPLTEFELVLRVPEHRIRELAPEQLGAVSLNAFPQTEIPFQIQRIGQFYEPNQAQDAQFRVGASLASDHQNLLPGMAGIARVKTGRQSLGRWIFGDLADWLWIQRRLYLPW